MSVASYISKGKVGAMVERVTTGRVTVGRVTIAEVYWDKLTLKSQVRTIMLASPDPYNSTETVEWCWEDFGLDWLIGEIRIRSGLSVYVRTASKYDDSRILFLPQVSFNKF